MEFVAERAQPVGQTIQQQNVNTYGQGVLQPHHDLQQRQQQQQQRQHQQLLTSQLPQKSLVSKGKYTLHDFQIMRTLGTGSIFW